MQHSGLAGASNIIYRKLLKIFLKVSKAKTKLQRTLIEAGQYQMPSMELVKTFFPIKLFILLPEDDSLVKLFVAMY